MGRSTLVWGHGELTTDFGGSVLARGRRSRPTTRSWSWEAPHRLRAGPLQPNGSLDPSFAGGKLTTDFGGGPTASSPARRQDRGRGERRRNFALARYNADGSLDTTFAGDGKRTTDFGGRASPPSRSRPTADRGRRGSDGASSRWRATTPTARPTPRSRAMARRRHDSAVRPGPRCDPARRQDRRRGRRHVVHGPPSHDDLALARYNADGALDPSFGPAAGDHRLQLATPTTSGPWPSRPTARSSSRVAPRDWLPQAAATSRSPATTPNGSPDTSSD